MGGIGRNKETRRTQYTLPLPFRRVLSVHAGGDLQHQHHRHEHDEGLREQLPLEPLADPATKGIKHNEL